MTAYLYPEQEARLDRTYFEVKSEGITTVGRHPSNDIAVLVASISRYHALIDASNGNYFLKDKDSSNGTFINDKTVSTMQLLREGDIVRFGHLRFTFSLLTPTRFADVGVNRTNSKSDSIQLIKDSDTDTHSTVISTKLEVPSFLSDPAASRKSDDHANKRLAILYRLNESKKQITTVDEFLGCALDLLFEALPADRAAVLLTDPQSDIPKPAALRRRDALILPTAMPETINISHTMVQQCIDRKLSILSRDTQVDERFKNSESLMMNGVRTAMCAPLLYNDDVLGVLFVDSANPANLFQQEDLRFLGYIALDMALILSNFTLGQENLKQARLAAVGATIAGLSHNIKNVLQLAQGGLELMEKAVAGNDIQLVKSYWPLLQKGVLRMTNLTKEMLAFSNQQKPLLQPTNVNDIIMEILESMENSAQERMIGIQKDFASDLPLYQLDPDTLGKALMNLFTNAIDAMQGMPGVLIITTQQSQQDKGLRITVTDNGPGMPPEVLEHIWDPFFSTKGSKGTGLGLPMTLKYIQDMNGTVEVRTEPENGTTFFITFPPQSADLDDATMLKTQLDQNSR